VIYHYRRSWALLIAAALATPLVSHFVSPTYATSADELRALASPPSVPRTLEDLANAPPQIDAWLRDHFGLRSSMIHAYAWITQAVLGSGNESVLIGREGHMFYRGDDAIRQSAGLIRRDDRVTDTANLLAAIKAALALKNVPLVVASPPNTATIEGDYLPRWARNAGRLTEADLFLSALVARGITTVDLRPALRAAEVGGKVYHLHDTHWTERGAIAAFNALAETASHPDWRIDAASVLGPPQTVRGGDLARMVGINGDVTEPDQRLTLPAGRRENVGPESDQIYSITLDKPGPTILVIGDSFSEFFMPMLAQHGGRVIFMHHKWCGRDWNRVEELRPNEVWWIPTERYLVCLARPTGFPSLAGNFGSGSSAR
jgi:alginate O-acetyltransferase complex protein AlgJ